MGPPLRESFAWLLDTDDARAIEQAIALYRERFADVGWRENVVYDGIPEALAALAAGTGAHVTCARRSRRSMRGASCTLFGFVGAPRTASTAPTWPAASTTR